MLILGWNALNWSESIYQFVAASTGETGVISRLFLSAALLPHLITEVLAYVLAGMAGIFLSTAFAKYKLSSWEFFRVSRACVIILIAAAITLSAAAALEIWVAQPLVGTR